MKIYYKIIHFPKNSVTNKSSSSHHLVVPSVWISLTLSLPTPPYYSSLPAGPQGYTLYPHRAAVCRFDLFALL